MNFDYRCIDPSGRNIEGNISAEGIAEAKAILKERGLTVLEVIVKEAKKPIRFGLGRGVKDTDIYNMSREMSILLRAGIRIDRAFEILINSVSNVQLKGDLSGILKDIRSGKSVAGAFDDTKRFNSLITTMIYAGESIGDIKSAFENIAQHLRFQIQFKSEIRNAMTYPLFLIFASFLTLFAIFKFIIPRFFSIFGQNPEASLPFTARLLYSAGKFLGLTNIYFFLAVVPLIIISMKMIDIKKVSSRIYSYLILIPLLRKLILDLELSRFSYSMYSMLNSGIEFITALRLSAGIIQHERMRKSIEPTISRIKEGKGIADVFSHVSLLPDVVPNMLRVGEESGNLKEIFFEMHRMFDERFKNSIKKILALVEPMVITVTGIIVGFIVISLILTVMSVGNIKL
ncbi:MAG: type II secretion system F family protein [Nitrospirae bacterium]|nr:type II secretion system F family protein [Nitrospirota bacterium]